MKKTLKYISISHQTASLSERECFFLNHQQQTQLRQALVSKNKEINGLMIVSTCNRTEIYFESIEFKTLDMLRFFIQFTGVEVSKAQAKLFQCSDSTIDTIYHLVRVANGLYSAITGDAQILSQVKEAYQNALKEKRQGSLLERAMQLVFRTHKRVINETDYHNGTQSSAYKALKLIQEEFGKNNLTQKKLLIIGAGKIANQVTMYLPKFSFKKVFIANRTLAKAQKLAQASHLELLDWDLVEKNDLQEFDAIISAVSNRRNLINQLVPGNHKKVCVDLAVPSNINKNIVSEGLIKRYGLDEITGSIEANENKRCYAIKAVENIIHEEMDGFAYWLKKNKIRKLLKGYSENIYLPLKESIAEIVQYQQLEKKNWIF